MDQMPTHDDANLILRLYELRREEKMRDARKWFVENFYPQSMADIGHLCPPGSEGNTYMRMVASYWEMAASFVTSGVLNEKLFFQSGHEMLLTWIRLKPIAAEARQMFGANAWRNMETAADRFAAHMNATAPGSFEGFVARMATPPAQAAGIKGN